MPAKKLDSKPREGARTTRKTLRCLATPESVSRRCEYAAVDHPVCPSDSSLTDS